VDKLDHARKRRLHFAAFAIKNLKNLKDWEYRVVYATERLFKAFDQKCTGPMRAPFSNLLM
jgi:hypothetical protein